MRKILFPLLAVAIAMGVFATSGQGVLLPNANGGDYVVSSTNAVVPTLGEFVKKCAKPGDVTLVCVHSDGVLALKLAWGNNQQVPNDSKTALLWDYGWNNDVVGIVAHNYLAGKLFYLLDVGSQLHIIWSDGTVETYEIDTVDRWRDNGQSLTFSPWDGGDAIKNEALSDVYFSRGNDRDRLVLMTCLTKGKKKIGVVFYTATRR